LENLNGLIQFTLFLMGKFNWKVEQIESRTASWNGLCSTFEGPLYIVFCISHFAHFLLSLFLAACFSLFFPVFIYFFVLYLLHLLHSCVCFLCFCSVFCSLIFFISNIYLISLFLLTFINLQAPSQNCRKHY